MGSDTCALKLCGHSQTGATYRNPVINQDFPDPNCSKVNEKYYAFATNFGELEAKESHIQVATSVDLVHWQLQSDALPNLPPWARTGKTWAPNVTHIKNGTTDRYVLYFVARDIKTDLQALGVATSKNPEGPYECTAPTPFMLQADLGGTIDPFAFSDSEDRLWLLFKNDGNRVGKPFRIYICPLASDAVHLVGDPTILISNDQPWEGQVVEAPFMWQQDGRYYLFYSGNGYDTPHYGVGYAVADRPEGPYRKSPGPILKSGGQVIGPGACCVIPGPHGTTWMLYHSWDAEHKYRAMSISKLLWNDGRPQVEASWDQPLPAPFA